MLIALLTGFLVGGPWLGAVTDLVFGYRWNFVDRCIIEDADDKGNGVDYCRLPVNCEICQNVDKIDDVHVSNITIEEFEERYAYSNRPLVVRNASLRWRAMKDLDYAWLRKVHLKHDDVLDNEDESCWFNQYQTKEFRNLRSMFRLLGDGEAPVLKSGKPWYVGWSVCFQEVQQKIARLYRPPSFIHPDATAPKMPWIFLGTPGPGARFHIDYVELPSWQAQVLN